MGKGVRGSSESEKGWMGRGVSGSGGVDGEGGGSSGEGGAWI